MGQIVPSTHFMIGPFEAVLLLGVLTLGLRWTFSVRRRDARMARQRAMRDFGLLVPVATIADPAAAARARDLLAAAGLRATLATAVGPEHGEPVRVSASGHVLPRTAGAVGTHVLVFPDDLTQARHLLIPPG